VEALLDGKGRYMPHRLGGARPRDYRSSAMAWDGQQRQYRVYYEFLFPRMRPTPLVDRQALLPLLQTLNAY